MHSYGSDGNFEFFHQINKDMSFTVRGNYTFSQNIIDYYEENKLPYDYLSVTGKPFNILRGYIAEGLFSSKEEINTSADQSGFGRIRPGDIKYRDVNGDGIINDDDKVPLSYSNQLPGNVWVRSRFSLERLNPQLPFQRFGKSRLLPFGTR